MCVCICACVHACVCVCVCVCATNITKTTFISYLRGCCSAGGFWIFEKSRALIESTSTSSYICRSIGVSTLVSILVILYACLDRSICISVCLCTIPLATFYSNEDLWNLCFCVDTFFNQRCTLNYSISKSIDIERRAIHCNQATLKVSKQRVCTQLNIPPIFNIHTAQYSSAVSKNGMPSLHSGWY